MSAEKKSQSCRILVFDKVAFQKKKIILGESVLPQRKEIVMLVEVYRKAKNNKEIESEWLDTDDLSQEDYVRFRELWDAGQIHKARKFLCEHVRY